MPSPASVRCDWHIPGAIGTAVPSKALGSVLSFCNSPQMNAPEAYIQFTPGLITDDGEVTVNRQSLLREYMKEFHDSSPASGVALPPEDYRTSLSRRHDHYIASGPLQRQGHAAQDGSDSHDLPCFPITIKCTDSRRRAL